MASRPQLNIICNRCGKPRGLGVHYCASGGSRKATVKPKLDWGKCGSCGKPYGGNPLGHVCSNKGDFKRRRTRYARQQRAKARKKRQAERHDYQACSAKDCPRPLCVAYKTGEKHGYDRGFEDGYGAGFGAGMASAAASA